MLYPHMFGDCLQLKDRNSGDTEQPAGFAAACSLSPPYRDWFNFRPKPYIQASQSTRFRDIPDVVTGDCPQLKDRNTTDTEQPAGSATTSSLSPP
ncbi:hypothetical protein KY285_026178 [Solanum tuberosum]|nr:hypothetical protein KY285_026178 [Solanum tuberosum]